MPLSPPDRLAITKWLRERGYLVQWDDHADDLLACIWQEIEDQPKTVEGPER